jgi:hypothetical protein
MRFDGGHACFRSRFASERRHYLLGTVAASLSVVRHRYAKVSIVRMRRQVLVVSYYAANPLTPRGARTQAVAEALRDDADVRVIGARPDVRRRTWWHRARDRALFEAGSRWLLDSQEPWSRKTFRSRRLGADVALLIGLPISPVIFAAEVLRGHEVPYVVDISDPWTRAGSDGQVRTSRDRRSSVLERELWSGAAAGIATTDAQARDIKRIVPTLNVLVRANGYTRVESTPLNGRRQADDTLKIGHFGNLYTPRVDVTRFLGRVAGSGRWRRVEFHQYGRANGSELRELSAQVTVHQCNPIPWHEVVQLAAAELDLALVVGNNDARQLPSKAIEYLTLPIPRLAVTSGRPDDALAAYVAGKPGWLTLPVDAPDPARPLSAHLHIGWTREELAPPAEESWGSVASQIASFVFECGAQHGRGDM